MKNVLKKIALAAATVAAVSGASATPIIGTAGLTISRVIVSFGNIDWNNDSGGNGLNVNPPALALGVQSDGRFTTFGGANSGSFEDTNPNFNPFSFGRIRDMSANPGDANYMPVGGLTVPQGAGYIRMDNQPFWSFDANFLVPGFPIAGAPFALQQNGTSVTASVALTGIACDMATVGANNVCDAQDDKSYFTVIMTTSYNNTTIPLLLSAVDSPLDPPLVNSQWSGTLTAFRIPEPGSMALLGLGLVGLAAIRRRTVK